MKGKRKYRDALPIPFDDPDPQVMIPYSHTFPFHCQIHRDSFSYGGVGPRADHRLVVDLRFFAKHDCKWENRVFFPEKSDLQLASDWEPGVTDTYGMPQPTVRDNC